MISTPLDTAITACTFTTSSAAGTTIQIDKASHGLEVGKIYYFIFCSCNR